MNPKQPFSRRFDDPSRVSGPETPQVDRRSNTGFNLNADNVLANISRRRFAKEGKLSLADYFARVDEADRGGRPLQSMEVMAAEFLPREQQSVAAQGPIHNDDLAGDSGTNTLLGGPRNDQITGSDGMAEATDYSNIPITAGSLTRTQAEEKAEIVEVRELYAEDGIWKGFDQETGGIVHLGRVDIEYQRKQVDQMFRELGIDNQYVQHLDLAGRYQMLENIVLRELANLDVKIVGGLPKDDLENLRYLLEIARERDKSTMIEQGFVFLSGKGKELDEYLGIERKYYRGTLPVDTGSDIRG